MRTASYRVDHGDGSAIFDAPSDNGRHARRLPPGVDAGTDAAQVVAELRRRYPGVKIALVGTSRGTITVATCSSAAPTWPTPS